MEFICGQDGTYRQNEVGARDLLGFWLHWCVVVWFALIWFRLVWIDFVWSYLVRFSLVWLRLIYSAQYKETPSGLALAADIPTLSDQLPSYNQFIW